MNSPQHMAEIVEVVRLIPQERVHQRRVTKVRSSAHSGAECPRPRVTGRGRNSGSDPDNSQERISKLFSEEDQL